MKKVVFPVIILILGLTIGYFLGKKEANSHLVDKNGNLILPQPFTFERVNSPIDSPTARRLIKEFRGWNDKNNPYPYKGDKNKNLKGFFIPKDDIDKIFNGHSNAAGLSFFIAKHPKYEGDDTKQIFTFIFMRADNFTATEQTTNPTYAYHNSFDSFDYVIPCPDKCGDFDKGLD